MNGRAKQNAKRIGGAGAIVALVPLGMGVLDYLEKRMEMQADLVRWEISNTGDMGPPDPRTAAQADRVARLPERVDRLEERVDSLHGTP
jgi:hypothetical protein